MPPSTALPEEDSGQERTSFRIPPAPEPPRQDEMAVTPPDQWHSPRKQGFLVQIPSGNVCRVHRLMDFMALAKTGRIPNPLGGIVMKMIESGDPTVDLQSLPPDAQIQMVIFMDQQVCRMMIDPKCMIPPEVDDDGEPVDAEQWTAPHGYISIFDLTQEDRSFLFNVSQGGTTELATFRQFQTGVVAAVEARPDVPRPTQRTNGPRRPRSRAGGH